MPQEPGVRPQQLIVVVALSTVLLGAAVLLWVLDVIPLGAMVAVIAIVAVLELGWIAVMRQRAARRRVQVHDRGRRSADFDIETMRQGPGYFPGGGGGGD